MVALEGLGFGGLAFSGDSYVLFGFVAVLWRFMGDSDGFLLLGFCELQP